MPDLELLKQISGRIFKVVGETKLFRSTVNNSSIPFPGTVLPDIWARSCKSATGILTVSAQKWISGNKVPTDQCAVATRIKDSVSLSSTFLSKLIAYIGRENKTLWLTLSPIGMNCPPLEDVVEEEEVLDFLVTVIPPEPPPSLKPSNFKLNITQFYKSLTVVLGYKWQMENDGPNWGIWTHLKIGMVCSSVDVVTVVSTDPCWPPSEKCSRFTSTVSFLTGPPENFSNKHKLWSTFFWSWWLLGAILVILCQIRKRFSCKITLWS